MSSLPQKTGKCGHPGRHRYWATAWHHVLPLSWEGQSTAANLVELCDGHHVGVHVLLDLSVTANVAPVLVKRVKTTFTPMMIALAGQAWDQRPAAPTRTRVAG